MEEDLLGKVTRLNRNVTALKESNQAMANQLADQGGRIAEQDRVLANLKAQFEDLESRFTMVIAARGSGPT